MLRLDNVSVEVDNKEILHKISLQIEGGDTHVLLGPNGSGKSTLLKTIIGIPKYKIVAGTIYFQNQDITNLTLDERSRKGIGLLFQNPPAVKGVTLESLCKVIRKDTSSVLCKDRAATLNLTDFMSRNINQGFSGGEIKRAEILQLQCQDPTLLLLDEPESGVDLDNIELIGKIIHSLLQSSQAQQDKKAGIIVTHIGYILKYLKVAMGHILIKGRFVLHGDPAELFEDIQKHGFLKKESHHD